MPYLDSFMKETARLSPGQVRKSAIPKSINDTRGKVLIACNDGKQPPIVSAPRRVMVPYTSPDGFHVPSGN